MKNALILGGGFAGCAAAHQLALIGGWDVTLVEQGPYLGAGVRTHWYGGHPYTFGPRHFLTPYERVREFLHRYVPLRSCADHEFLTYVEKDQNFYTYPIHVDDFPRMPDCAIIENELAEARKISGAAAAKNFEDYWIASIGRTLYGKFVDQYSKKMWMVDDNKKIDSFSWSPKGVTIKQGPRAAWDTAFSGYPEAANGYDDYFDISTKDAKILLNRQVEEFDIEKKRAKLGGEWRDFDIIVSSISPDILGRFAYGELPYVGRDLIRFVLPIEFALPEHVYFIYYAADEPFTRLTEYKKFTRHKSDTTLVTLEVPSKRNKLYPVPIQAEMARAQKYFDSFPEGVFNVGRNGTYRYGVDVDDTILHALTLRDNLTS
jgi:UDP-galactopyranose mutase